jgi:small-conductance mechanosensitive channel
MDPRRLAPALLALLLAAATAGVGVPATAQSGPLPKLSAGDAPSSSSPPAKTDRKPAANDATGSREATDAIDKGLAAAQAQLDAIEASPGVALGAPPGTPASEIADRLSLARQLPVLYQQQRDLLDRIDVARTQRLDAERALESWSGFPTAPPYSVLLVDGLREAETNAQTRIANGEARRALFERLGTEVSVKVKASQAAARLAAEAAERARAAPDAAQRDWQRGLATLRARVDEATQDLLQMAARNAREDIAAATAARDLARRQLAAIGSNIAFPAEDLARINAGLDSRTSELDRAIERAGRASAAALDARVAAEKALADARAAPVAAGEDAAARAARVTTLAAAAELNRELAITAATHVDLLKGFRVALDGERLAWKARADAIKSRDPVQARAGYERLVGSLATLRAWREYLNQQLVAVHDRIAEQEARLRVATDADAAHVRQLLDTFRQRENTIREALERGQPLERLLEWFRADFEGRRDVSFADRARDTGAGVLLWVRRAWNFELFTVDDTFETADGRKLEVARSVTIGKTAGAVLVVVLGYWLSSLIARRVERLAVVRGRIAPQSAALLRSWILFVVAAILVIFALVSASIPLTAFAFLGGALAIAAGFGLQTLLKNFVAGVMLLFERPMRLDDLVEVDGIRGRVTSIGIRASTITSADGIETLIPNSAFVENKLTNWTYSSPTTRHTIKVGVAYGTPLRRAADTLLDVLARHGRVLKDPAPQVYLDEYADSSVNFALTYWLDMTAGNDSRRIRSDLLHMIDGAFADAGIAMPFPQRDVHLDAATPLRVEVVGAGPAEAR